MSHCPYLFVIWCSTYKRRCSVDSVEKAIELIKQGSLEEYRHIVRGISSLYSNTAGYACSLKGRRRGSGGVYKSIPETWQLGLTHLFFMAV